MPTKTWAVGEEVLAADFNAMVQQQVVATFPNAAARTAALAAPTEGMLTYLSDTDRYDYWNGAAWMPIYGVGPPIGSGQRAVAGTYTGQAVQMRGWLQTVATGADGHYGSGFPSAVNGVLSCVVQLVNQYAITTNIISVTTTGINGIIFATSTNTPQAGNFDVLFMALVW